ncbi:DUF4252 domain-containing protein [uncultured Polaribacter sp.]|uniref:DUF4252 domain-containing protein n=1 Tax=uncultured Polaribacter sp. TaxID=174711 RepID=UPI00263873DB|nr:DUF4252 domain-containing protein [uncultured Polaribacter sp.]
MKRKYKYLFTFCLLVCLSCGANHSFRNFYNAHKNDRDTTSFQAPNFMYSILRNVSPEMGSFFQNISNVKFITFNNITRGKQLQLFKEINTITTGNFTDMILSNSRTQTKLVSVKENGPVVTQAIIFNSTLNKTTAFYLRGSFDPEKLRSLSETKQFDNLSNTLLLKQNNFLNPSFNPNQ